MACVFIRNPNFACPPLTIRPNPLICPDPRLLSSASTAGVRGKLKTLGDTGATSWPLLGHPLCPRNSPLRTFTCSRQDLWNFLPPAQDPPCFPQWEKTFTKVETDPVTGALSVYGVLWITTGTERRGELNLTALLGFTVN